MQLFLRPLALGDVPCRSEDAENIAACIFVDRGIIENLYQTPVFVPDREGIVGYKPLFKYLPVPLCRLLGLRKILREVTADKPFPRNARDLDSCLVSVGDLSFGADGDQRVQAGLDEASGVLRRLAQLFLRPLALGDVPRDR